MKKMRDVIPFMFILFLAMTAVSHAMQDPTRPVSLPTNHETLKTPAQFELTAIFIYPEERIAVINQQLVKVGDTIGNSRIEAIDENAVTLMDENNQTTTLTLIPEIKQPR